MRPIVALLTDFGSRDHYGGALRGAALAAAPDATVVDIVHDLPRRRDAARVLVEGSVLQSVRTYADVAEGEACALVGSSQRLEVAVNRGSAERVLGASLGAPVRVRRAESRML